MRSFTQVFLKVVYHNLKALYTEEKCLKTLWEKEKKCWLPVTFFWDVFILQLFIVTNLDI